MTTDNATSSSVRRWVVDAPIAALIAAVFSVMASVTPGGAEVLEWSRAAVARGEVWRIVSGHFVHFGSEHLLYDVGAWLVLGIACERRSRGAFLTSIALAAVVIPIAVALTRPDLHTYRGLSGLDSALFALLITQLLREDRRARPVLTLVALGFVAKLVLECTGAGVFATSEAFVPVPIAHAVGACVGLGVALTRPKKIETTAAQCSPPFAP